MCHGAVLPNEMYAVFVKTIYLMLWFDFAVGGCQLLFGVPFQALHVGFHLQ